MLLSRLTEVEMYNETITDQNSSDVNSPPCERKLMERLSHHLTFIVPACKHNPRSDDQLHEGSSNEILEELTTQTKNLGLKEKYCPLSKNRSPIKLKVFRRHELEVTFFKALLWISRLILLQQVANKIGNGAYGGVWQATIIESMEDVVVKVVWPDFDLDPEDVKEHGEATEERLEAFRREIEMMELAGSHPKIVKLLGATHDSRVIVLEEALSDLHTVIKNQAGSLHLSMISKWTRDVLEALHYLHSVNIVHRDVKPGNILIFDSMVAKLGDFGMSREFVMHEKMAVGREICTLWYRAPELLMGAAKYSPKIDVWAVGCLVMEMLIGNSIFKGNVDDICQCRRVTHRNYNGDQLHQIFQVCGTPIDSHFLRRMDCFCHFKDWPVYEACLERILSKYCTVERISNNDPDIDKEVSTSVVCNNWLIILQGLLDINPDTRFSVAEALEIQWLQKEHNCSYKLESLLSRQEPAVKRVLEDTPVAKGNNDGVSSMLPTSCA